MSDRRASEVSPVAQWRGLITGSELPWTARLVALVLSTHMNRNGGSCHPSLTTIAQESGLGRSTVCRALAELERSRFLRRDPGGPPKRPTRYRASSPTAGLVVVPERDSSSPAAGHEDVHKDVQNLSRARARAEERKSARAAGARSGKTELDLSYLDGPGR